jgi:IS30 family transposase
LVENHNGLLRQYYPKGESFTGIKEDSLRWVEEEINERPRKLLEYACPMLYLNRLTAAWVHLPPLCSSCALAT